MNASIQRRFLALSVRSLSAFLMLGVVCLRANPIVTWETDDSTGVTLRISDQLSSSTLGSFAGGSAPAFDLTSPSGLWHFANVAYYVDYRPAIGSYGLNSAYGMTGNYTGEPAFRFFTHGGITYGSEVPDFSFGWSLGNFQTQFGRNPMIEWGGEYIYHFMGGGPVDFSTWRYEITATIGPRVPDTTSTLFLLGGAFCGLAVFRKQTKFGNEEGRRT